MNIAGGNITQTEEERALLVSRALDEARKMGFLDKGNTLKIFTDEFLKAIYDVVDKHGPISRVEVTAKLGLPATAMDAITSAVKGNLIPGVESKRGVGGGLKIKGRDYPKE